MGWTAEDEYGYECYAVWVYACQRDNSSNIYHQIVSGRHLGESRKLYVLWVCRPGTDIRQGAMRGVSLASEKVGSRRVIF